MEDFTIPKNQCAVEHLFPDPYWISPDFRAIWTEIKGVPPVSHCIIYHWCISNKNKCPVILSFPNWIIFQWVHCNPLRWRDTEEDFQSWFLASPQTVYGHQHTHLFPHAHMRAHTHTHTLLWSSDWNTGWYTMNTLTFTYKVALPFS